MQDPREVRAAVDDLIDAILAKDIERIQSRYVQEDRLFIFLEGWEGKIEGFEKETNAAAWRGLLDQVSFSTIELTDDARAGRDGDLGWVGGTTRSRFVPADGEGEIEVEQRATWILERVDSRWVIVFEHVSFPKDRPYGTEAISS